MSPKHLKFSLTILLSLALLIALVPTAKAASILPACVSEGYCTLCDILQTVVNIGQFLLGIVGSLALLMFVYGGFTWLTSGGEPDKITAGKKILINSVIGLAITFFAYVIVIFVISTLAPGWSWQDKMNLSCAPLAGLEPPTPPVENQLGAEGATCATSTACNTDLFCDGTGKCSKKLALGAVCNGDATTTTLEAMGLPSTGQSSSYACISGACKQTWIVDGINSRWGSGICVLGENQGLKGDPCTEMKQCKGYNVTNDGKALYCRCNVRRTSPGGCGGTGSNQGTCQEKNVPSVDCWGWTSDATTDHYVCMSNKCHSSILISDTNDGKCE